MIKRQTIVTLLSTTAIAFAIAPPARAESLVAAVQAAAPSRVERSGGLQQVVKAALGAEPELHGSRIAVSAHAGQVTLAGVVGTEAQRALAVRTAAAIRGVDAVENALELDRD